MTPARITTLRDQLLSLAAAAVLTTGVLLSLGAQADHQHANVMAQQAVSAQLCAAPARGSRS